MDRFDAMAVLLQVVEYGSLSAAGRKLGVPLTTVSRKISDLESHLGARLLVRSNRRVTLTEAGQSYVAACRRILGEVAEAEQAASGEFSAPRGELTITAPVVFGRLHILPVVTEFLLAYPDIDIRLTLADRLVHLQDDHIDVAIRIGILPDSSLKALRLGMVRRMVYVSPAYVAAHGAPLEPGDLIHHSCITFSGLSASDNWTFNADGVEQSVPIRSRLVVNTAEAAVDAAVAGLGVTRVLSYQTTAAQNAGLLVTVLDLFGPAPVPVSMVFDGQGPLPIKLRAFLDFAGPRLKDRISAMSGRR